MPTYTPSTKEYHFIASVRRTDSIGVFYLIHWRLRAKAYLTESEAKNIAIDELHAAGYEVNYITKPQHMFDQLFHRGVPNAN